MYRRIGLSIVVCLFLCKCQKLILGNDPPASPVENFECLWKTIDERYSFFEYKNIDWNTVYLKYQPQVSNSLTDLQLNNILIEMLSELRDAHVNLVSPFRQWQYEGVFDKGNQNFNFELIKKHYLSTNYFVTGPLIHQLIDSNRIGYVRYADFSDEVTDNNLDFVIERFVDTKGIIIDLRDNGGGFVSGIMKISSRFTSERRHIYTSFVKDGAGHEDFTNANEVYIDPAAINFTKKVCVLTNRGCYSATSFFVLAMRNFPNVTIVGDTTGGGLGAPTSAELPNGWAYSFSASRTLSTEGENFEDGIPPDVQINLDSTDIHNGFDTIIEKAISIIEQAN